MTYRAKALPWAALCIAMLWCGAATAHSRSVSYSYWTLSEHGAQVRAHISQLELSRAGILPQDPRYMALATRLLTEGLQLYDDTDLCGVQSGLLPVLRDGQLQHEWQVICAHQPQRLSSRLNPILGEEHSHFVTLNLPDQSPIIKVLTAGEPEWQGVSPGAVAAAPDGVFAFAQLGLRHILSGWDHLLFLLALVVLAKTLGEVAWLATGFTLGHSLTLALAVFGLAKPAPVVVEALIALSIVGLALENGWRMQPRSGVLALVCLPILLLLGWLAGGLPILVMLGLALFMLAYVGLLHFGESGLRLRLALTAAFGLFHGFGFAGVLTGMHLAPGQTAQALLGFNLGVEAGQLVLLALVWPLLRYLRSRAWPVAEVVSASAAGIGVWVYLSRLFS